MLMLSMAFCIMDILMWNRFYGLMKPIVPYVFEKLCICNVFRQSSASFIVFGI
jgi:hypothetical protein